MRPLMITALALAAVAIFSAAQPHGLHARGLKEATLAVTGMT